jgi:hypothetical protein
MILWQSGLDGQPNPTGTFLVTENGETSAVTATPGYNVIIVPALMQSAWTPYQVQAPISRVWGGDDPASPAATVQLVFPDLETACQVLAGFWTDNGL